MRAGLMTMGEHVSVSRAPWHIVLATVGALGVVAFLIVVAVTVLPPVLAERDARVSDGVTESPLGAATVVAPDGWVVFGDDEHLTVRTPDGALTTTLAPTDGSIPAALQELVDAELGAVPSATVGPFRTETLTSGLRVVHTDVGADAVFAVLADGDRALVSVVARVDAEHDLADYRPALSQLLEGVRP